jgi:hypothetical protein
MRWKIDYAAYILGCSITLGNVLLEAGTRETIPLKRKTLPAENEKTSSKRTKGTDFFEDPGTGIQYRELNENPNEIIVEMKYPDGQTERYIKTIGDAKTAFENEALKTGFKKEDFYEEKKQSIIQAISSKSPEKLNEILTGLNPQEFIAYCPNLLDEVDQCLFEINANKNFTKKTMNILRRFGFFREEITKSPPTTQRSLSLNFK